MKRITPTISEKFLSHHLPKLFNKVFFAIPVPVQRRKVDASFNHVLYDCSLVNELRFTLLNRDYQSKLYTSYSITLNP